VDNDIIARDPVDGSGDTVLITCLEGVDNAEDLSGVAAGGSRIGEDGSDGLLGVDNKDGADGERNPLGINIGGILVVNPDRLCQHPLTAVGPGVRDNSHIVKVSNLSLLVANNGELESTSGNLINVLDPAEMALDGVGRDPDQFDTSLGEFGLELGEGTKFGGADWSVILRVGEEHNPVVSNKFMEVNWALSSVGFEVGSNRTQAEASEEVISIKS
jgi:hypothetical protein